MGAETSRQKEATFEDFKSWDEIPMEFIQEAIAGGPDGVQSMFDMMITENDGAVPTTKQVLKKLDEMMKKIKPDIEGTVDVHADAIGKFIDSLVNDDPTEDVEVDKEMVA